ncbi:hypothetical protein QAD02_009395 [Eretmocerus hayati]|uniref:Uncharacterized protein n=1 Tax=Eretmocerus hayati TaxID=131215 RepID=A0ACC2N9H8_9HYME|nr:hypothetical protein QAD02_009395 [Eretmocerus hayati]
MRNDFSQIFQAFLKNLEDAASKVSGAAKAKIEQFKKMFMEMKDQISVELEHLKEELTQRMEEAKKYGEAKYQEMKQKAKEIFEQKQVEFKNKVRELQQKVTNYLDGVEHQQIIHAEADIHH